MINSLFFDAALTGEPIHSIAIVLTSPLVSKFSMYDLRTSE